MIKNPQANSVLERVHQVFGNMLRTSELDMVNSVNTESVSNFSNNAAWAVFSTYHIVLKSSPGAATFGWDMLFNIPYLTNWNKIGEYRQAQSGCNALRENASRVDFDYAVGRHVLVCEDGIFCKAVAKYTGPLSCYYCT